MSIVRKQDRVKEVDNLVSKIFDYPLPDISMGLTYQEINGRVPSQGAAKNTVCDEFYYVLGGSVQIVIEGETDTIGPGDVAVIPTGISSYLIGEDAKLLTITNPDWYTEQNEHIDEIES
jgi:mannose-6-phosphate isomerase-like protein (cupin superfamily)